MSVSSHDLKRTDEVKERLVNLWDEVQSPSFLYSARQSYIMSNFGGDIPSFQKVQSFLNQTGAYDWAEKKWTRLDGRGTNLNVEMQCILTKLVRKLGSRGMRVFSLLPRFHDVVFETRLDFEENWAVRTTPDLVVTGKGENFKDTIPGHELNAYLWSSHIERTAGVVMVRTDMDFDNAHDKILLEAAYYASECFYEQGNRIFFHVVVVTNSRVQLLRFDRSGCLASPATNIHECPGYFIQCLLLLSTMKDTVLGFDKMITWNGYSRFIETENLEKKDVKYRLLNPFPVFRSFGMQGRYTTCWRAIDEHGEEVIIKDTHRGVGPKVTPEWKMLLAVHGVEGIGQMLGYEEDISLYNRRGHGCIDENFEDRMPVRLTLKAYGQSIRFFRTRQQFLFAFRDAVAAHRNLWNNGILHRDVSLNNVLLGSPDAPIGKRGILIDLDAGVKLGPLDHLPRASDRSGTLSYFSTTILRFATRLSYDPKKSEDPRDYHTHWEDLQSFFYLLCHICLGYSGPGEEADPYPLLLEDWNKDYDTALEAKKGFLDEEGREIYKATAYFGELFDRLLIELYEFLERTEDEFSCTLVSLSTRLEFITKGDIDDYAKKHYEEYLAIIDRAIVALEQETQGPVQPAVVVEISARRAVPQQLVPTVVAPVLADIKFNSPQGKRKRDTLDEKFWEKGHIQGLVKARQVKRAKKAKSAV